jgi:periplasmic protein TonB
MNQNLKNIPDWADLIFKSRNKEYGSYKLRKRYNYVLIISALIAYFIACCAVIIPFLIEKSSNQVITVGSRYVQAQMDAFVLPMKEFDLPALPPRGSNQIKEIKYIAPEAVDTITTLEKTLVSTDEAQAYSGDTTVVGNGSIFGDEDGSEFGELFIIVEKMPSFMGGDINKFRQWIQRNTVYPQEAIDNNIKGKVILTFIVEKNGSVSNVTIVKGVHPLLDNAAVKVISESPGWSPGIQRGHSVRVRFSISLVF